MKNRIALLSLVLLLLTALAGCSSDDKTIDLNGKWTFTFTGGYSDAPSPWRIVQNGNDISIIYDSPGVNILFSGSCDPSSGTFVATFAALNHTFTGQSTDGDLINGTWTAEGDSGTFIGVRRF